MSNQDDGDDIFTKLGLTIRQAEVYLTIVKLGQPTVKSIAQTLQIARAEVYRATPELQKLGLIKKIVTTPISFRATPLSEGLSILLEHNAEKHKEIRAKSEQFLRNFKNCNREKPSQENFHYRLTSGFKAERREFSKGLRELQTSSDGMFFWRGILFVICSNFENYRDALKRGVKFRYIVNIPEDEKMPQIIQTLKETGSFEVKSASIVPKVGIDILDKKNAHIITATNADDSENAEIEVLRSNYPAVVALFQDYFELKWQSATPRWHKKNNK